MILIRCKCGQALGKVAGRYEIICHKCGARVTGETVKIRGECTNVQQRPRLPREMLPLR
jgi:ribosomal protein L40E